MFSNSAKPTVANLRSRVSAVIEAAHSGHMVGAKWRPRDQSKQRLYVKAMKNAEAWAFEARRALEG